MQKYILEACTDEGPFSGDEYVKIGNIQSFWMDSNGITYCCNLEGDYIVG